jgi:hypothetical protein
LDDHKTNEAEKENELNDKGKRGSKGNHNTHQQWGIFRTRKAIHALQEM